MTSVGTWNISCIRMARGTATTLIKQYLIISYQENKQKKLQTGQLPTKDTSKSTFNMTKEHKTNKNKICMLSTNNHNKLLGIAEQFLSEKFQICHYLTPGVGVKNLLRDVESKVAGYTMEDYCLIFIGENDFKTTQNYAELVWHIRNYLTKLDYTNIIVCLPTFNCGNYASMFNRRVETFNDQLYRDVMKHEYAYIIDSNLNLTYDNKMFSRHSGRVNNYGFRIIFEDISNSLIQVENDYETWQDLSSPAKNDKKKMNSEFFRINISV